MGDEVSDNAADGTRADIGLETDLIGESPVVAENVPPLVHKLLEHHTRDLTQRTIGRLVEREGREGESSICGTMGRRERAEETGSAHQVQVSSGRPYESVILDARL